MESHGLFHRTAAGIVLLAALAAFAACGDEGTALPGGDGIDEEVALLLRRGKVDQAKALLDGLAPDRRVDPKAVYGQGALALHEALASGDPGGSPEIERAEALFRDALKKDPSLYLAKVHLGKILGIRGKLVEGVKTLDEARESAPDRADAYFELGRIYLDSGELPAACESVTLGLEKDSERADGYMFLGDIFFIHRRQPDEGLKAMRTALKLDPELPGAARKVAGILLTLASKTLGQKKHDDTLRILAEVDELTPGNMETSRIRGQVYDQTDRTDLALEEFRKYFEADPSAPNAKLLYAGILVKRGYQLLLLKRRDEGFELLRKAVDLKAPNLDVTFVSQLLNEYEKTRERDEGEGDREKPDVEKAKALYGEASTLLGVGRAEEALKLLQESLVILPENPFAHHQAGVALDMLARPEEAEKELKLALRQAKELKIRLPATYLKLAEIAIKDERYEEGEEYLDRHAELYPDQADSEMAKTLRRLLLLK